MPNIEFHGLQESEVDGIEDALRSAFANVEGVAEVVTSFVPSRVRELVSKEPAPMVRIWRTKVETGESETDPMESPEDALVAKLINWFTKHGLDAEIGKLEEFHPSDLHPETTRKKTE